MNDKRMRGAPNTSVSRRGFIATTAAAVVTAASSCSADRNTPEEPPDQARSWGAFMPSVSGPSRAAVASIDRLAAVAGAKPYLVHLFAAIADSLPVETFDLIRKVGSTPILSLEPWLPDEGRDQSAYSLASIAAGHHDSDLARWGAQLSAWPHPMLLRFAQEMNGTWYPWSIGVNGNTAAHYRVAWSRMHSIISEQASHVRFVWAPNSITEGTREFTDCYPGNDVVDYLGLDGYNWGDIPGHQWQSAEKLFSQGLSRLNQLSPGKPIIITEVGCADGATPNLKAEWIDDFFTVVGASPNVSSVVWFQMDKERDWRFNSSPASTAAFREGLAKWLDGGRS